MNQSEANEFLSLGMNVGIFMMSSMLAEHEPEFNAVKQLAADEIQKITGLPAEDWALKMDGILTSVLSGINLPDGEKHGKG